jgi:hypothetical protein
MEAASLNETLQLLDAQRARLGFQTITDVVTLAADGVTILDPHSTLISVGVSIGAGTVIYPNVVIEARDDGTITIGGDNRFYPGTIIVVSAGRLAIGAGNTFGPGGVTIEVSDPGATLTIGDGGRYSRGAHLSGANQLESGSQVLGPIEVRDSYLAAGGDHREPDPDLRGGVLKGVGLARQVRVGRGEVISTRTTFQQGAIERQAAHHR